MIFPSSMFVVPVNPLLSPFIVRFAFPVFSNVPVPEIVPPVRVSSTARL